MKWIRVDQRLPDVDKPTKTHVRINDEDIITEATDTFLPSKKPGVKGVWFCELSSPMYVTHWCEIEPLESEGK